MGELVRIITAADPAVRNRSLDGYCRSADLATLLTECRELDRFRRESGNLYERVRALFFLYAIYRFHIPGKLGADGAGQIPFEGHAVLLKRRFDEAIDIFLAAQQDGRPSIGLASALARAYYRLGFQTLADQVRRSVRSVRGNQWMFRTGHASDFALRIRPELLRRSADGLFPILHETTPVRMDLSHSGWSDIFFLGMDYPEGARVLNVSIDLAVRGAAGSSVPKPPVEAYFRVIDQPVLRLVSVDLGASADVSSLSELFDFARDYLGLLKAAVIASGLVPAGMEGAGQTLANILEVLTGKPGLGIEIVSKVNEIPKGSRLAVSTNLLACLISVAMRATGQSRSLDGQLQESDRRLVAARAILGEWLGGSGGGWQDSGGVWPGMKIIQGVRAAKGDPEFGISRGCLLPVHEVLDTGDVGPEVRQRLEESLVLVHGGMAQDVGPILEMVTEKYLLRSENEWAARQQAMSLFDGIVSELKSGNIRGIGSATQRNFDGPLQAIIPWASNYYTESLIRQVRGSMGDDFWGFWMLGGMSGGGMGFIFDPRVKSAAQDLLQSTMSETKRRIEHGVAFAMEPVVYNFAINERGTYAELLGGPDALMPAGYYALMVPPLVRTEARLLPASRRAELDRFGTACRSLPELSGMVQTLFDRLVPRSSEDGGAPRESLDALLDAYGFDRTQHEEIQAGLRNGRIGLAQNRLPASANITDVRPGDVFDARGPLPADLKSLGEDAFARGAVAVVTLAGGAGSRWTRGAGVVKALNPFAKIGGRHRNFIEIHLAKSRRASRAAGRPVPHVITTSYLTHEPIRSWLEAEGNYGYEGQLMLSQGRSIGLRMVPMVRDLRFAWEESPQQMLDERQQRVREGLHATLINWATEAGEANNYTDNLPLQCLHPVGHWYEVPNMFLNGTLLRLIQSNPDLKYLMLHNVDTLGADLDAELLGRHIRSGAALSTEVIAREAEDRGGGLARIDGRLRLVEGLALPDERIEFGLSFYNSVTSWIDIDRLLAAFSLQRSDLSNLEKVSREIRAMAARLPTYITLKDVKKRWGKGQEDIFPVTQWEKLWGDMTALPELDCRFFAVRRERGQQLKEPAQLDGWLRDGSAAYVETLCEW